jgi:hypothetical protein
MESVWMLFILFKYGGHNWREWGGSIDGSAGDAKGPKEELFWKLSA